MSHHAEVKGFVSMAHTVNMRQVLIKKINLILYNHLKILITFMHDLLYSPFRIY